MALQGGKLAGGNPVKGRVENDFYATNPKAVEMLLSHYELRTGKILEPCVGQGHIARVIQEQLKDCEMVCVDLVDRGYPHTIVQDFLEWETEERFSGIVSNPPYSLAKEFIEKCMTLLEDDGQMAMFLKIQFLEGQKRKALFEKYPPKYVYVFRNRMATWNNGQELDSTGKKWATTMCHAWFVWEKGSQTETIIRWL